ncbi:MAG: metallophosphoesterase, partial [Kibdelosporangium sp.]
PGEHRLARVNNRRMTEHRPRPRDDSEEQLGFRRRRSVRWLAPSVLISSGIKSVLASIFGSYADKRELQGGLPGRVHQHGGDELWFDFVADLGDGFDATFSVASLLAAPRLDLDGHELPRGQLLVMGGDEVYPAASPIDYEDRTKGPYRAALPEATPAPTLFALPGNHDWYDGLTAFLRVFAQGRDIGGWSTEQTRSYFAIELPQRWWLFAIDTQFGEYIDAPQLEYFRAAAAHLREGDAVILCTPKPSWVDAGSGVDPRGYDVIEFFDREVVQPSGATTRVMISGDAHHYARYSEQGGERQRITSGAGGAYLSATHTLPESLTLPPKASRVAGRSAETVFTKAETYPSRDESAGLATGIFRLPWRNPGFWELTAILQTVLALFAQFGLTAEPDGLFGVLAVWAPTAFAVVGLVVAGVVFAQDSVLAGLLHSAAHLLLAALWAVFVLWLQHQVADWVTLVVVFVATPVLIGFLDAEVVALYLLLASRAGINVNEAFAGQAIEDHKGFVRLHIDTAGDLTIYPVKVPRVVRKWRANPAGAPQSPWLLPDGEELTAELIEAPIKVSRG